MMGKLSYKKSLFIKMCLLTCLMLKVEILKMLCAICFADSGEDKPWTVNQG